MNTKIVLESLSMDLKRVAIGYHRGSEKMAERFVQEAIKRKNEVDYGRMKPYMRNLLEKLELGLTQEDKESVAEFSLLTSTLLQNYTQVFMA